MKLYLNEENIQKKDNGRVYLDLDAGSVVKIVFLGQLYLGLFALGCVMALGLLFTLIF